MVISFPFYSVLDKYLLQRRYKYKLYHSYGKSVRTYLDGFNPYKPTEDIDDEEKIRLRARRIFKLLDNGVDGGINSFFGVLRIVLNPSNQPVLFHCFGGRHRTGMITLAIRYL